jgi:hypothetical protein
MDKKGKILLVIIIVLIFGVVGFKYKQFFADRNFQFIAQVNCDPATESCFRVICDGECDTSSGLLYMDGTPYKYVEMPGFEVPQCLPKTDCKDFTCPAKSETCITTLCSDETLGDGEECITTATSTPIE